MEQRPVIIRKNGWWWVNDVLHACVGCSFVRIGGVDYNKRFLFRDWLSSFQINCVFFESWLLSKARNVKTVFLDWRPFVLSVKLGFCLSDLYLFNNVCWETFFALKLLGLSFNLLSLRLLCCHFDHWIRINYDQLKVLETFVIWTLLAGALNFVSYFFVDRSYVFVNWSMSKWLQWKVQWPSHFLDLGLCFL